MAAGLLLLAVRYAPAARAQQRIDDATNVSDLAGQNLSRVAASAAEIKAVLVKDAGLMVELKHWVARDATDHGQILNDSDLTGDAIFARLETDIQFRSITTALIQRYGYLLPKLNPDSDVGKEHALLIQERTKWMAKRQGEELTQSIQGEMRNAQDKASCDPRDDKDCTASQTQPVPTGGPREDLQQGQPPFGTTLGEPNPSNGPSRDANPLMRAQGGEDSNGSTQFPSPESYGASQSFDNVSMNNSDIRAPQSGSTGPSRSSRPPSSRANDEIDRANDGLLAAYGNGMGMNIDNGTRQDGSSTFNRGTSSPPPLENSPAARIEPPYRRSPMVAPPQHAPEMVRERSPYDGIPSLYDMYVQAVTRPVAPNRFGAQVFENGTRDSQMVPMDLPVGPDYVVGPGDALSVDLWGGVSQRLYRVVDREGRVSLPEVGPILVSGKSLAAVQQNLQQILRTQFRDVSADVSLARLRTIRVYEVGDVTNPGAYDISSLSTPLNALFSAGGPTQRGSMRILKHYRGNRLIQTVDVYDLLLHGVKIDLQRLENGDTVQVPSIGLK